MLYLYSILYTLYYVYSIQVRRRDLVLKGDAFHLFRTLKHRVARDVRAGRGRLEERQ